jgi:hypothetical protein
MKMERIKTTLRLKKTADPTTHNYRFIPAQGRVYVDVTIDKCQLAEYVIFSGNLNTAEDLYDGFLTLTADSRLVEADGTERKL